MKLFLIFMLLVAGQLFAEEWKVTGDFSLNVNQSLYSDNWVGEEMSNINWTATVNASAERQLTDILHNRNTLRLDFGQTHRQIVNEQAEKNWEKPEKTTDDIILESILRFTLQTYLDPFVGLRIKTQFLDLSVDNNTRILNPTRITESAGVARSFITEENHHLSARLGAAFRQIIDRDRLNFVTDEKETEVTYDGGIEFIAEYRKRFLPQNINYNSRLEIYQALYNSEEDELENDYWKAVDVTWEHNVTTKLWSFINAVFFFELIYEKEEDRSMQFRQTLGLGLQFQLF